MTELNQGPRILPLKPEIEIAEMPLEISAELPREKAWDILITSLDAHRSNLEEKLAGFSSPSGIFGRFRKPHPLPIDIRNRLDRLTHALQAASDGNERPVIDFFASDLNKEIAEAKSAKMIRGRVLPTTQAQIEGKIRLLSIIDPLRAKRLTRSV